MLTKRTKAREIALLSLYQVDIVDDDIDHAIAFSASMLYAKNKDLLSQSEKKVLQELAVIKRAKKGDEWGT